jgi:hypothetical protein
MVQWHQAAASVGKSMGGPTATAWRRPGTPELGAVQYKTPRAEAYRHHPGRGSLGVNSGNPRAFPVKHQSEQSSRAGIEITSRWMVVGG